VFREFIKDCAVNEWNIKLARYVFVIHLRLVLSSASQGGAARRSLDLIRCRRSADREWMNEGTSALPSRSLRLPTLDGWRAIAVGLVIWAHASISTYPDKEVYFSLDSPEPGAFGVDIFFAISGLLITTLLLREKDETGAVSLRGFYVRRAFRILPPCFLYLAVVASLGLLDSTIELLGSIFFFRNYLPTQAAGWHTSHLWSLAVEEHFYLIWPIVLIWLIRKTKDPTAVAYLAIAAGLWRIVDMNIGLTAGLLPDVPRHFRSDLRADALLWGCYMAFLLSEPKCRERVRRHLSSPVVALTGAMAVGCVLYYSYLSGLWFAMLVPVILAGTMLNPTMLAGRFLELKPLRFVGKISYSLYLWQQLFFVPGWMQQFLPTESVLIKLALTFLCAVLSYRLVEKPCMTYGRRLSVRLSRPSVQSDTPVVEQTERALAIPSATPASSEKMTATARQN
jgi:peptidoglycan/LPS O-acetylase OafA/YrhL